MRRAAIVVALLAAGAMAQSYTLVANVLDGAGRRVTSAGYQCQFSLAQSVASAQLASADYRAVLGFWNRGFRTGVNEPEPGPAAERFRFVGCQPNPVAGRTVISYQLYTSARVRLDVLDHSGRLVGTLVNARQEQGAYRATWDLSRVSRTRLPNGVYFLRFSADELVRIDKAVIAR